MQFDVQHEMTINYFHVVSLPKWIEIQQANSSAQLEALSRAAPAESSIESYRVASQSAISKHGATSWSPDSL